MPNINNIMGKYKGVLETIFQKTRGKDVEEHKPTFPTLYMQTYTGWGK